MSAVVYPFYIYKISMAGGLEEESREGMRCELIVLQLAALALHDICAVPTSEKK
jgi:hypothetical protein